MAINSELLRNVDPADTETLLNCIGAKHASYNMGDVIFMAGDKAEMVGMVVSGQVHVLQDDYLGNRSILSALRHGDLFGEAFACVGADMLPVSVVAATDCQVLLLDYRKIITTCPCSCTFHQKLIENMLSILAQKNIMLNRKNQVLAGRSIRERLLQYLHSQAGEAASDSFSIPFNRQQLADYLAVDRSALSRELGRLQKQGIIRYSKNRFELLQPPEISHDVYTQ